jgi:hypothetical protein
MIQTVKRMDKHRVPKRLLKEMEVEEYPGADLTFTLAHVHTHTDTVDRPSLNRCRQERRRGDKKQKWANADSWKHL